MGVRKTKVVVYGGNGFVGTRVCERLSLANAKAVAVSRTGQFPKQLREFDWAKRVSWKKGDASSPDMELLETCDVMVCLVGSPPLRTFSKKAYDQQLFMNGTCNVNAIEAAAKAGIKKVVLLGAKMPASMQKDSFAYAKGKRLSLEAASKFSDLSKEHTATVIQPGGISGRRFTRGGLPIPLDIILGPLSKLMPSQLVSVDRVADRIVLAALDKEQQSGSFSVILHANI